MVPKTQHASCVTFGDAAVLITGASGSGKSALSLQLMALGGLLVADDKVILTSDNGLVATCPATISGKIEARGVGILNAEASDSGRIALVIDMNNVETDRLPQRREITIMGCVLPLLYRVDAIHFAAAIAQMLRTGRSDPA